MTFFEPEDVDRVEDMIQHIHRPAPSLWATDFARGNVDVFVVLLLSRLNALEELDLRFGYLHRAFLLHLCYAISSFPALSSNESHLFISAASTLRSTRPIPPAGSGPTLTFYALFCISRQSINSTPSSWSP
jgi:hypothetical protein